MEGDVPTPRSGHSLVAYKNRYLLLFGGIDFTEQIAYNDLYCLDLGKQNPQDLNSCW